MKNADLYKERAQLAAVAERERDVDAWEKKLRELATENERQVTLLSDLMEQLYQEMPDKFIVPATLYMSVADILLTISEDAESTRTAAVCRMLYETMAQHTENLLKLVEADTLYSTNEVVRNG